MYGLMLLNSGSSTFLRDILRIFLFCSRFSFLWSLSCLRYTLTCIASHVTSRPLSDTFCITRVIMSSCPLHTNSVVCVCVFFPSILDIKFVGRTSRGHTGFLIHLPSAVRALIFVARRIQPFLSLVDREVEFCVLTN